MILWFNYVWSIICNPILVNMFIILVLLEFTTRKLFHNLWTMRYKFSAWKLPHTMKNVLKKYSCFLRHLTRQHVYDNLSWWNTLKILDPELLVFMILKLMMLIENTKIWYYLGYDWNLLLRIWGKIWFQI